MDDAAGGANQGTSNIPPPKPIAPLAAGALAGLGFKSRALVRARRHHNGILLMHDRPEFAVGSDGPLKLTQWLVPRLRAEGYRFGSLSSMLIR